MTMMSMKTMMTIRTLNKRLEFFVFVINRRSNLVVKAKEIRIVKEDQMNDSSCSFACGDVLLYHDQT